MNRLFADTSFYIAILNPRDRHYLAAVNFMREYRGSIVTTDFVLIELANFVSRKDDRHVFVRLKDEIAADPDTDVLPASRGLFERGIQLYRNRHDKDWSLTDCISFVVMDEERITGALTVDHHFEQAGFQIGFIEFE